jgi:hypothetical protein
LPIFLETIPEHSSTRSLKLARRKRTKLKKSARTSQLKEADSVSVASTSNGEQIPVYSEHKSEDEDERLGDDADNDDDNDELEYQKIKQKTDHSSRSDVKIGIVRGKKTYNRLNVTFLFDFVNI